MGWYSSLGWNHWFGSQRCGKSTPAGVNHLVITTCFFHFWWERPPQLFFMNYLFTGKTKYETSNVEIVRLVQQSDWKQTLWVLCILGPVDACMFARFRASLWSRSKYVYCNSIHVCAMFVPIVSFFLRGDLGLYNVAMSVILPLHRPISLPAHRLHRPASLLMARQRLGTNRVTGIDDAKERQRFKLHPGVRYESRAPNWFASHFVLFCIRFCLGPIVT